MRAFLYTRVSTSMQVEDGFSLDAQLDRLRSYCDSQDWSVVGIYTDEGQSAKDTHRKELQRMLADLEQGKADVILVYKLDRLTRSVLDLHALLQRLERMNVGFKSATEPFDTTTPVGRLFITIVAALAQWERETLAERVRMGQVEMTRQGKWSGGRAAFGYDYDNGELRVNEPQANVVREIFRRYISGHGTTKILQWLNNPDHPQLAPNRRWTLHALKYLLSNPLYSGKIRYGYRTVDGHRQKNFLVNEGNHPAIIDEVIWQKALQVRQERGKFPARTGTGTYPLTGLLKCGMCGSAMAGRTQYRENKQKSAPRRYYICTERIHSMLCTMPMIREELLDELIQEKINAYRHSMELNIEAESKTVDRQEDFQRELRKLEQAKQRFIDAFAEGKFGADLVNQQLSMIAEKEAQIRAQMDEDIVQVNRHVYAQLFTSFAATWPHMETQDRRQMAQTLFERIIANKDGTIEVTFRQ